MDDDRIVALLERVIEAQEKQNVLMEVMINKDDTNQELLVNEIRNLVTRVSDIERNAIHAFSYPIAYRPPQQSHTAEALSELVRETKEQTPLLKSIVPSVESIVPEVQRKVSRTNIFYVVCLIILYILEHFTFHGHT